MIRINVIRTEDGHSRRITLTEETFKKITDKPKVFGAAGRQNPLKNVKYERAPIGTPEKSFPKIDIPITDNIPKVKIEKQPEYIEVNYLNDRESGKVFLKSKEYTKALECFVRAEKFKPSPYMRSLINKCK